MKRRTEITIRTNRLVVISRPQSSRTAAWCDNCAGQSTMLSVEEAASLARSTSRAIYQRIEAASLHFTETTEGRLLVCLNSLQAL